MPKETDEQRKKSLNLVDELYQSIWAGTRAHESNIVQYIAGLISVIAVEVWGLQHQEFLLWTTVIAQVAMLWILFVTVESGYKYRVFQGISNRIEKMPYGAELAKVLPQGNSNGNEKKSKGSYSHPKSELPEMYRFHCVLFTVLLIIVTALFFYFDSEAVFCAKWIGVFNCLPAGILTGGMIYLCFYHRQRMCKLEKDFKGEKGAYYRYDIMKYFFFALVKCERS